MDEQLKLMQQYMGDDIVRGILIPSKLQKHLQDHPVDPIDNFDLNPHLHIKHVCEVISKQVVEEGVTCTPEDVMQLWLTIAVYHGELLSRRRY